MRRGVGEIWRRVERDDEEQLSLYSDKELEEQCIVF
jgi:hypothetical protein